MRAGPGGLAAQVGRGGVGFEAIAKGPPRVAQAWRATRRTLGGLMGDATQKHAPRLELNVCQWACKSESTAMTHVLSYVGVMRV